MLDRLVRGAVLAKHETIVGPNVDDRQAHQSGEANRAAHEVRENQEGRVETPQAAVQGEQLRVSGKKRDDLQQVIQMLKGAGLGVPLQFNNFRD